MRRIPRAIPVLISVAASLAVVAAGAVPALGADHRERVLVEGAPLVGGSNGMFFDADNNLYVAQVWGRSISKLDPETGKILEQLGPAELAFLPDDVTVGPDGTLFWTDPGVGSVFARRPGGPSVPLYPFGAYPSANPLTLSDDGTRLFFAQCYGAGPNGVYQLDFTTWATTPILQGIPGCASNAMDYRDGALYSPRPFEGRVVRVDLATKAVTNVTTGWGVPIAVKFDSQGNLYAANQGNGELVRIDLTNPDTATNREVIARLPVGWFDNLAFDKDDRLYISSASEATVLEVLPGGGFRTVSPGGMSLSTGVAVLDGTVYTVQPGALYGYDANTGAEQSTVRSVYGIGPLPPLTTVTTWGDQLVLMSVFTGALMLWDPGTQTPTLVTHFAQPVDATPFRGDLIVTEAATGNVVRASGPGLADREVIATMPGATGLAATEDNVYVGNAASGEVLQIIADGKVLPTALTVASGLKSPEGLDLRSNGTKLLVVDGAANTLSEVNLVSGTVKTLATDLDFFSGLPPGQPLGWFNNVEVHKGSIYINADAANVIHKIPAKGNAK
jgi:sugar lactone lactonase YvrE